jgi:hypothetical protein
MSNKLHRKQKQIQKQIVIENFGGGGGGGPNTIPIPFGMHLLELAAVDTLGFARLVNAAATK